MYSLHRVRLFLYAAGATCLCGGLSSCATTNVPSLTESESAADQELALYDDEQALWDAAARLEERIECGTCGDMLFRNEALDDYVQAIANRLLSQFDDRAGIEVRTRVIKSPAQNAFVLPNGAAYVSTGLIVLLDNEDQLATVLGHELAHFLGRHSLRRERRLENKRKWSMAIGVLTTGAGLDVSTLWAITSIGGYSRELEMEADNMGLRLMVGAGYDAAEAPIVFEKLLSALQDDESEKPFAYASHPKLQDRLNNFRALMTGYDSPAAPEGIKMPGEYVELIDTVFLDNVELEIEQHMRQRAWISLDRFLARNPDSARAYFLKGKLSAGNPGDGHAAALQRYKKAMTLDRTPAEAYREAGLIHRALGEHTVAAEFFRRYLEYKPDAVDAPIIRGYEQDARASNGGLTVNRGD